MSSNVGLSTPRGSGTSGYVQRNLSTLKPRDQGYGAPYPPKEYLPQQRQPDKDILDHDRQREIEVKVFDLRDKLEDEGVEEDEAKKQCDALREKLRQEGERRNETGKAAARGMKSHQVHGLAEAKIVESEKLRRALGIRKEREGKVWDDDDKKKAAPPRGLDQDAR